MNDYMGGLTFFITWGKETGLLLLFHLFPVGIILLSVSDPQTSPQCNHIIYSFNLYI